MKVGKLFDIDMVRSGITIMTQVFEGLTLDCTHSRRYLDDPEYIHRIISKDREQAKLVIDRAFHGGKAESSSEFLTALFEEFKRCWTEILIANHLHC